MNDRAHIETIEHAMVAIRRSQRRRTLARLAGATAVAEQAMTDVIDAVEAAEQVGEPATVVTVAEALDIDQPRASKLVAAAVAAKLVRRRADQADGRRALLLLTASGRARAARVHQFRRDVIVAATAGWSKADRARFAALLDRFVTGLVEVTGSGPR